MDNVVFKCGFWALNSSPLQDSLPYILQKYFANAWKRMTSLDSGDRCVWEIWLSLLLVSVVWMTSVTWRAPKLDWQHHVPDWVAIASNKNLVAAGVYPRCKEDCSFQWCRLHTCVLKSIISLLSLQVCYYTVNAFGILDCIFKVYW